MTSIRRDHLVDTALKLFSRYGFHATGIDRILSESGVAKMTLYKHFKSKDDLILAALQRRDELHRAWLTREIETLATAPRERLLALFTALGNWFESDDFNGCCFINATAEYGDTDSPIHKAADDHKRSIRAYILELAEAAEAKKAGELADQLMLLMEGAIVAAHISGKDVPAQHAKIAAEALIGRAISAESIAA